MADHPEPADCKSMSEKVCAGPIAGNRYRKHFRADDRWRRTGKFKNCERMSFIILLTSLNMKHRADINLFL